MKNRPILKLIYFVIISSLIISCTNDSGKNENSNKDSSNTEKIYEKAKIIFYSMPSPLETTQLFNDIGVIYNEDILNSTQKISNYTTNQEMGLNLGIYSADLSYSSIYNENQNVINYMAASKKLSTQLGILESIDDSTIVKLKDNMNNKQEIMKIISETFMRSNAYLQENNRDEIACYVITGGWLETLYISTQLSGGNTKNNPQLVEIIYDMKLSLSDLVDLLNIYKDNQELKNVKNDIFEIKSCFDKMQSTTDNENYATLCKTVEKIRNSYTK